LLQIDEAGLISLVNKKIREKAGKRDFADKEELDALEKQAAPEQGHEQTEVSTLLQKDYLQEKGLLRILLEYGDRPYDEKLSIAEYIRLKIADPDFTNAIWKSLYDAYLQEWNTSLQYPTLQKFTYHELESVRNAAIESLYYPYELSENWEKEHHISTPTREMTLREDVDHTVTYFILRKLKTTYYELLESLRVPESDQDERITQMSLMELKKSEAELLNHLKVVAIR
jgi:DNA primase